MTYVVPGRNPLGERNLRRLRAMGVDHVDFRLNPRVERTLIEKSFRKLGIAGLAAHMAIYTLPIRLAVAHDVPLVIYGENSAFEYGTEDPTLAGSSVDRRWLKAFGVSGGTTAEDWIDDDLTRRDLSPLFLPADDVLQAKSIRSIFLGYFFPWDPEGSYRVASRHGFEARAEGPLVGHYDFVNIDDDLLGIHQHAKWYKFGIARSWDTLSMEIRSGRMRRDEAIRTLQELGDETPWDDIRRFCEYLGIPEEEYFSVLERFRNPEIWSRRDGRWAIEGFLLEDFPWRSDR